MSRLHIYTVHANPTLSQPYEAAEFIEESFNWKAFFFTGFWALYHKMWWVALALFAFNALMLHLIASSTFSHCGLTILDLGARMLIGYYANDWRRANLKRRGFITVDIVSGDSLIRGQQRFFDRYFATHSTAAFAG